MLQAFPGTELEVQEITFLPPATKELDPEDLATFEKFLGMLNDCDDVQDSRSRRFGSPLTEDVASRLKTGKIAKRDGLRIGLNFAAGIKETKHQVQSCRAGSEIGVRIRPTLTGWKYQSTASNGRHEIVARDRQVIVPQRIIAGSPGDR